MVSVWRVGVVGCLLLAAAAQAQETGERVFEVSPELSNVHWRVYKAGAFARFGHNHVISIGGLSGTVRMPAGEEAAAAAADAEWDLEFAVGELVVDDPELRSRYGEEFSSVPSEDDIAGTRTNMLTEQVLNGAEYPRIRLSGRGMSGTLDDATLDVEIEMLGRTIELDLPSRIAISNGELIAEGEFSLQHEDLGMTPFSVMMGALQVGPQLDFTYRIHAVESDR